MLYFSAAGSAMEISFTEPLSQSILHPLKWKLFSETIKNTAVKETRSRMDCVSFHAKRNKCPQATFVTLNMICQILFRGIWVVYLRPRTATFCRKKVVINMYFGFSVHGFFWKKVWAAILFGREHPAVITTPSITSVDIEIGITGWALRTLCLRDVTCAWQRT